MKTQQVHPGNVPLPTRGPTSPDYLNLLNKLMIVIASSVCCVCRKITSSPPTKIHPPTCGSMSRYVHSNKLPCISKLDSSYRKVHYMANLHTRTGLSEWEHVGLAALRGYDYGLAELHLKIAFK